MERIRELIEIDFRIRWKFVNWRFKFWSVIPLSFLFEQFSMDPEIGLFQGSKYLFSVLEILCLDFDSQEWLVPYK